MCYSEQVKKYACNLSNSFSKNRSNKMPRLVSLHIIFNKIVFLWLILAFANSSPAQAGYWRVSYSSRGSYSYTSDANMIKNWSYPSGGSGVWTDPTGSDLFNGVYLGMCSGKTSGTVTVTLTYVPNPSAWADPPPAKVALREDAVAGYTISYLAGVAPAPVGGYTYYSGNASDGRGDPLATATYPLGYNE